MVSFKSFRHKPKPNKQKNFNDATAVSTAPRKHRPLNFIWRHKYITLIIIVILLLLVGGLWWHYHNKKPTQKSSPSAVAVCTTKSNVANLMQAAGAIRTNNIAKQQQAVAKIQKLPNYQKDPNCLYAVVSYYINRSDAKDANLYLNELIKVYNVKQGYSGVFVAPLSIATLKNDVATIERNAQPPTVNKAPKHNP